MLKSSFLSNDYLVSDDGYVLSKNKKKKLKPSKNKKGYLILNLMINGKRIGIALHILVARAYCPGYKPGYTVNHKNGDKSNCKASNLEWISNIDNIRHSINVLGHDRKGHNNPNAKKVQAIDKNTKQVINIFSSVIEAAQYINPNASDKELRNIQKNISRVATGQRNTYKSIIWKYI